MSVCNSTINGGLAFGSEVVLESRYVWSAVTVFDCNSPTNPHLLQGDLTVVLGRCVGSVLRQDSFVGVVSLEIEWIWCSVAMRPRSFRILPDRSPVGLPIAHAFRSACWSMGE